MRSLIVHYTLVRKLLSACLLILLGGTGALAGRVQTVDFSELERIPIQENGRKKPYRVFADESLLTMAGTTRLDIDGRTLAAIEIISSLWLAPEGWSEKPVILINHKGLKEAAGFDIKRKHFSHAELAESAKFRALLQQAAAAKARTRDGRLEGLNKEVEQVGLRLAQFEAIRNGALFRVVPNPAGYEASWTALKRDDPRFVALRSAYLESDPAAFAAASDEVAKSLAASAPALQPARWKIDLELLYEKAQPFRVAWILYLAAAVALSVTAMSGKSAGYVAAWVLVGAAFGMHLFGFVCRVLIAGRPPVTNMYESIIWVAFGTVFFALIFEGLYRSRYFFIGAIPVAVVSLVLAESQPLALSPSIQPLVAVLQSNFWLTTHVLTITLSYAAFALALGVGHIALFKVLFGSKPSPALYNYIYRALQVGVLLLASGTILGGVWANYSWGRFWDWDPKETWALIALLTYLFILHGRIAGAWSGFGTAIGAVLGFQSVIMAWYGVNFVLGVGLHSYGFGSGGFGYALGFVIAELAIVIGAVVRHRKIGSISPTAVDRAVTVTGIQTAS